MMATLERQVQCVKREIGQRQRVYPRLVQAGKMPQAQADEELEAMRAVLATLQGLQQPDLLGDKL